MRGKNNDGIDTDNVHDRGAVCSEAGALAGTCIQTYIHIYKLIDMAVCSEAGATAGCYRLALGVLHVAIAVLTHMRSSR